MTFRVKSRGKGDLKTRYRPRRLSEVAPTTSIARLKSTIDNPKASRVFLFEGPPGTGKTTCARILARASVCEAESGEKPCLKCTPCKIMEKSGDFSEINVADERGIDDMRSLSEKGQHHPMYLSKTIVILDEVHRLTGHAQEMLLKEFEEPADHMLVFMCTTETKGLRKTLLQRADRFVFKPIDLDIATELIKQVCEQEEIELPDEDTIRRIYQNSEGAARLVLNHLQAYAAGGFEEISDAEDQPDDVKKLFDALMSRKWPAVAAALKSPGIRAKPESARIGVECIARALALNKPFVDNKLGMLLDHICGTLHAEPLISQYNVLVLRCMKLCSGSK